MSGVVFFGWGEIFSLFPSTLTDTFGTEHATSNYGFLYLAFGVASVLGGPLAALLHKSTGSWLPVFELVIAMNFADRHPRRRRAQADAPPLARSGRQAGHGAIMGREALKRV